MPADSRQGVPQSRPSAAGVPTGMRAATPNKQKHSRCPKEHTALPPPLVMRLRRISQCHIKNIPDRSAAVKVDVFFVFNCSLQETILKLSPLKWATGKEGAVYFIFITEAKRDNCRETGWTATLIKIKH